MCRPSNRATTTYSHLSKSLIQMTSNRTSKMKWCAIALKPHVLMYMQWHIFQQPMQYVFKKIQLHVTGEIRWEKVWSNNTSIQKPCPHVETATLLKAMGTCSIGFSSAQKWLLRKFITPSLVNFISEEDPPWKVGLINTMFARTICRS